MYNIVNFPVRTLPRSVVGNDQLYGRCQIYYFKNDNLVLVVTAAVVVVVVVMSVYISHRSS